MALVVVVAVMNVLVAAALPFWSQVMKRDREAELIFRGLQYAEAMRVFQLRFGRYPNTLDELIEVNPRSIRRLWKDPMTDDGRWEVIRVQGPKAARPREREPQPSDLAGATGPGGVRAGRGQGQSGPGVGPIVGVRSRSTDSALREFMGGGTYSAWQFTADLIPAAVVVPGTLNLPRPTSDWIGRPFRESLQATPGSGPGGRPAPTPGGMPSEDEG